MDEQLVWGPPSCRVRPLSSRHLDDDDGSAWWRTAAQKKSTREAAEPRTLREKKKEAARRMPHTAFSISPTTGYPMSNGATADYGFDKIAYELAHKPLPSRAHLERLASAYVRILQEKGAAELHRHQMGGADALRRLLRAYDASDDFEWVAFM